MSDLFAGTSTTEPAAAPLGSRSDLKRDRRAKKRKAQRRRRTALLLVVILAVLAAAGWVLRDQVMSFLDDIKPEAVADYPGPGIDPVDVTINPGDTGSVMGRELVSADVVESVEAFNIAFEANPNSGSIQPGTHQMLTQMSAEGAVARLVANENRVETKLTIPEGYTVDQILERATAVTGIAREDFEAAMEDNDATGLPDVAGGEYEGWLFPTTYLLAPDSNATSILSDMVTQTVLQLDDAGVAEEDREEVLTEASLIEREAANDEDRAKMARAIDNRIEQGMPLQIDAAVAYGAGKPGTELTTSDLEDESNEYNLYVNPGLPPTPIAAPGRASIDAVMNPADGDWLFWTTVNLDTGETKFAATYEEHQENVAELREWQAANG
ncbi:hypothetical protein GCM10025865_28040 [Paraoerskovia sediminicola]|uniref:Endolytic murein transglycosylase n=1 Tax=Paraoerskovia sediminicola TaxID=1138587 RepID=A0ABN6XFE7_9CELL|nr:endolytic transglycosylase MltG [Paraoerskovia sediminicola]BDZ43505.1 hypothetical protein GCM10025865_28040 [Paraoerskovia sediminicola]